MSTAARREREREERRSAILEAAERVFGRKGLLASTMEDIAAEAELSKGALYLYFKNKDELFVAQSSRTLERLGEHLGEASQDGQSGLETLRKVMLAYAEFAQQNAHDFSNAMQWILSGAEVDTETPSYCDYRGCVGRILGGFAMAVSRGQKDGSIRADLDPVATGARMWSAMLGPVIVRINADRMIKALPADIPLTDTDNLIPQLVDVLCRGLATQPAQLTSKGNP